MFEPKVFIHIPKNAGMTVRSSDVLRPHIVPCNANAHKNKEYTDGLHAKMKELGHHHGNEHARWRDLNYSYKSLKSFAVIRNPWDRVVSRYFFLKKVIEVEGKSNDRETVPTFEEFLEERHEWGGVEYMWHRAIRGWSPATDYVCCESGVLKCDMLRFEKLNLEIQMYFGVPQMSGARNVTGMNKGSYMDVYDDNTTQIVADWYKSDIDLFGFDFDTGATRNHWFANQLRG